MILVDPDDDTDNDDDSLSIKFSVILTFLVAFKLQVNIYAPEAKKAFISAEFHLNFFKPAS